MEGSNFGGDLQARLTSTLMGDSGNNGGGSETTAQTSGGTATTGTVETDPAVSVPAGGTGTTETPATEAPTPGTEGTEGKIADPSTTNVEEEEFEFEDEKPATTPVVDPDKPVVSDEDKPWSKMLPKEVEATFLKTARGRRMLAQFHTAQELERPPEEGGLGYSPTVNQIKEFASAHSDLQMMSHEFHSGNPQYAANFIKQWFGPDENTKQISSGAQIAAKVLLPTLMESSPELGLEVARSGVVAYIEELYDKAASSDDKDNRVLLFNVARILEDDVLGKHRDIPEALWKEGKRAAPGPSEVDQKLQRINQFEAQQRTNAAQQFTRTLDSNIGQLVNSDIDSALDRLKEIVPNSIFSSVRDSFHKEVVTKVQSSPNFRQFIIARDMARTSRQMADVQSAAKIWRDIARPVIKHLRAQYLSDAGNVKLSQSASRHATLEEASQKRGVSAVSQPTEKNLTSGPAARQPGESHEEYILRKTRAVMSYD